MNAFDKANAAQRLLENDDFKLIMSLIEADLFDAFQKVKSGQDEALKNVHMLSLGFNLVKNQIPKYIQLASLEASIADAENDEIY